LGDFSVIGDYVDCYCVGRIEIGSHSVISQYCFLCSATHDYQDPAFHLVVKPIRVGQGVWIAADAFIGPGVSVGDGAVVGARSVVLKDVEPRTVVAGNPARFIKKRTIREKTV
jgi:putative colanic acid biosynthesis acetyltransferase WcaF